MLLAAVLALPYSKANTSLLDREVFILHTCFNCNEPQQHHLVSYGIARKSSVGHEISITLQQMNLIAHMW